MVGINLNNFRCVCLDFDGTIADSQSALWMTIRYLIKHYKLDDVILSQQEKAALSGMPIEKLLSQALRYQIPVDQSVLACAQEFYQSIDHDVSPLPGVELLLSQLAERAVQVYIVSNGQKSNIQAFLSAWQLEKKVAGIYTPNAAFRPKPEPDMLLAVMAEAAIDVRDCVMIGDHPYDIRAAQAADCASIAVATGAYSLEQLQCESANWVVASLDLLV